MRLRYRGVDYCEAAARECHEKYVRSLLLVPNLPNVCGGLDVERSQLLTNCITDCMFSGNLATHVSLEISFEGKKICGSDVKAHFLSSVLPFKETFPCSYKPESTIRENRFVQQEIANFEHEINNHFFEEYREKSQRKNENATFKLDTSSEDLVHPPLLHIESMVVDWPQQEGALHLHILQLIYATRSFNDDKLRLFSLKEKIGLHPGKIQPLRPSEHVKVRNLDKSGNVMPPTIQNAPDFPFCNAPSEVPEKEILSHTTVSEKKFRSLFSFEAYEVWVYYDLILPVDALPLFPLTPTSLLQMHFGFQGGLECLIQMSEMPLNPVADGDTSTSITIDSWNILSRKCALKQDQDHTELFPDRLYFEVLMTLLKNDDYVGLSHSLPVDNWDPSKDAYNYSTSLIGLEHKVLFFEVLQIFEEDVWCTRGLETVMASKHFGPVSLEVSVEQAPAQSFETLIVMPQLTMDSNRFQTLLVPLLSDCKEECDLGPLIIEAVYVKCKNFVVPASDWLYLDWHLTEGRDCSNNTCFNLRKKLREEEEEQWKHIQVLFITEPESLIHSGLKMLDEHDFVNKSAALSVSHNLRYGSEAREFDSLEKLTSAGKSDMQAENPVLDCQCIRMNDKLKSSREDKVMNSTMSNDLTFFIRARKGSGKNLLADGGEDAALKENYQTNGVAGPNSQKDVLVENRTISSREGKSQCTIHIHDVELSAEIGKILQQIGADYKTILEKEENIVLASDLEVPRKLSFESMGHTVLMSVITAEALKQKTEKRQQLLKVLIALYVLWQTALNLYDYGLQVAHLYLENLLHTLEFLDVWLHESRVKLEEAFMMVENGYLENHPKLKRLEMVLRNLIVRRDTNEEQHTPKICILGQRRAFFTLYKTLGSLSLKTYEIDREETLLIHQQGKTSELEQAIGDALSFANCLLVPPKYINSYFPIEKITVFILYAQSFWTDEDGCAAEELLKENKCQLHVLHVKKESVPDLEAFKQLKCGMEERGGQSHSNPKVSIDPLASLQNGKRTSTMGNMPRTTKDPVSQHILKQEADQLKWSIPAHEHLEAVPQPSIQEDTFEEHKSDTLRKKVSFLGNGFTFDLPSGGSPQKPPVSQALFLKKRTATEASMQDYQHARSVSKLTRNHQTEEQRCACIIVVNIMLSGGFILSARRSSYQNILNLEKRGVQVVERELRLPVDLILSAAICLVLYTYEKFKFYTNNLNPGITSASPCLEYIIDNHMKAISFSFKSCIMIFEGPDEFTTSILANIDEVYAAAVGLNICVQCFTSKDAAITDTIILGCIQVVQRSNDNKSFPLMAESRTLTEAFLSEFPSVNPLTAHAIVCSGVPLPTFMSLTHDEQLLAAKAFDLPEHSMLLFKIQCQYGKVNKCGIDSSPDHLASKVSEGKSQITKAVEPTEAVFCKATMGIDQRKQSMMSYEHLHVSDGNEGVLHEWPINNKGIPCDVNPYHGFPCFDDYTRANKTYYPQNALNQLTDLPNFIAGAHHRSDVVYEEFDKGKYSSTRSGSCSPLGKYQNISSSLTDNTHGRHPSHQGQKSALRSTFLEDYAREPLEAPNWKLHYPDIDSNQTELGPSYTKFRANHLEENYQKFATLLNDDTGGIDLHLQQQNSATRSTFLEDYAKESVDPQNWKLQYPDIDSNKLRDTPPYLSSPREIDHDKNAAWENQFLDLDMKYHSSGPISGQLIETDLEDNFPVRQPMSSFKSGGNAIETAQLGSIQAVLKDWLHSQEKARAVSLVDGQQGYKFLNARHQKPKQQLPGDSLVTKRSSEHSIPKKGNSRTPQTQSRKNLKKLDQSVWKNYSYKSTPTANFSIKNNCTQSSLSLASSKLPSFKILSAVKTPEDKKASQSLTYIKVGNDKQSRLIWSPMGPKVPQLRKRARPDAAYTL